MGRPRITVPPPHNHLTLSQLSEATGVPVSTLNSWWKDRELFAVTRFRGRQVAVDVAVWNAFAEANGQPTVTLPAEEGAA